MSQLQIDQKLQCSVVSAIEKHVSPGCCRDAQEGPLARLARARGKESVRVHV